MSSYLSVTGYLEESAKALRAAADAAVKSEYMSTLERHRAHLAVAEGFARLAALGQGLNPWAAPPAEAGDGS